MRVLVAIIGLTMGFGALAVEKPVYKKSDTSLYGAYEYKGRTYPDVDYIEYRQDENGQPSVFLGSGRRATSFDVEQRNGILVWGGDVDNECDDPGCGYMTRIEGTIEPIKYRGKYVPHMKVEYTYSYDYPDEEDAPEGEITDQVILRKTKDIEYSVPYYKDLELADVEALNLLDKQCKEAKHTVFRDLVACTQSKSWQFRLAPRGKAFDKFLAEESVGTRENLLKVKTEDQITDGFLMLLEAGIRHGAVISAKKPEAVKSIEALIEHLSDLTEYLVEENLEAKGISLYLVAPIYGGINDLSDAKLLIVNYKLKQVHRLEYKAW